MPPHAVYPGTFDPFTAGHLDVVDRARRLFTRVTVLVAVNADKNPTATQHDRVTHLRAMLPPDWDNVHAAAWSGLTVDYCRTHHGDVIIRGLRNQADMRHELPLAAMNEHLGVTTLFLPARPELATTSSTMARALA
ncbi:pantetheine-phosphate adenylyltransferase [Actinoplanes sichuanensis]|uniref:Phosphopantetheine adenylyltransferase n=1 Tax=Actinoplanes sichuanensis TaxID=512349 RepID=A0ABW4AUA0_9ACTN|nr:pantetheine-phosphate adenylyltransferase [Actinoplanes sichuanensis]BEL05431.1 pantetheine-phosphate adenylyltransferase [Actinoplanes sichuanensis]